MVEILTDVKCPDIDSRAFQTLKQHYASKLVERDEEDESKVRIKSNPDPEDCEEWLRISKLEKDFIAAKSLESLVGRLDLVLQHLNGIKIALAEKS